MQWDEVRRRYSRELERTTAFWLENGIDPVHDGVYTCLDRSGKRYASDKSVWMQGRCAWTFSRLCNLYGPRKDWLEAAGSCIAFLDRYCTNPENGRMYFTVTADGWPLRQRRYYFSETFSAMAHAEYFAATGSQAALQNARACYALIWQLYTHPDQDPFRIPPKVCPETRQNDALGPHMILLNVCGVLERCDRERAAQYRADATVCIRRILDLHWKPELGVLLENVGPDGAIEDWHTAGRQINPGHILECSWFLLDAAQQRGDAELAEAARAMFDGAIRRGWDTEYGGILYFVDLLGCPPEQYEHDMKLWWPHNEAILASLKLYQATGDAHYLDWFIRLDAYAFEKFSDPAYGEWFGYLRRDGLPTLPACKGSTYKGPFHLPRMLMEADRLLSAIA